MLNRVLFTGGSGLLTLGWAITIRATHSVFLGLHRHRSSLAGTISIDISLESIEEFIWDLKQIKPNLVIHTAGLTNVDACESNPTLAFCVNSHLSKNVATATHMLGIPLIHISTDHLSSGKAPLASEQDPVSPLNVYAKSKFDAEKVVATAHPEALIIRTNFFGWGPAHRRSFSDEILHRLRHGERMFLFDDVYYTPILIAELAKAAHELIQTGVKGLINIAGSERITKYRFGCRLAKKFGLNHELLDKGSVDSLRLPALRPKDMSLSNALACQILGRGLGSINSYLGLLFSQEQTGIAQEIYNAVKID